jgi:hypothetical protein
VVEARGKRKPGDYPKKSKRNEPQKGARGAKTERSALLNVPSKTHPTGEFATRSSRDACLLFSFGFNTPPLAAQGD